MFFASHVVICFVLTHACFDENDYRPDLDSRIYDTLIECEQSFEDLRKSLEVKWRRQFGVTPDYIWGPVCIKEVSS